MDPLALGAAFAVLVVTMLGIVAFGSAATSTASKGARDRLQNLFGSSSVLELSTEGSALREKRSGEILGLGQLLAGREWAAKATLDLDQADLHLRVGEYAALRVAMALLFFVLAFVLISSRPVAMVIGMALGVVGFLAPAFFVTHRKRKRLSKLESQLEEALTLTANSLKAGFGLLQSLEMASQQLKHPIATELRRTLHDINIGSSTEDALVAFGERGSSKDLDIVITAILIQRTVGGNLAEILDTVANTMRERARIRGHVKAVTSQQRVTGYVLGALPIALMCFLFVIAHDYMTPLFTTLGGQVLLVGAGIMEFIGMLLIRRILAIEV